jgi:hypothetical protein
MENFLKKVWDRVCLAWTNHKSEVLIGVAIGFVLGRIL